jgi:hypothetical protein
LLAERLLLPLPLTPCPVSLLLVKRNQPVDLALVLGVIADSDADFVWPETKEVSRLLNLTIRGSERFDHLPDVDAPSLNCSFAASRGRPEDDAERGRELELSDQHLSGLDDHRHLIPGLELEPLE